MTTSITSSVATADVSDSGAVPALTTPTVDTVNRMTAGELVLHFAERDVAIVSDGETAARVLAVFAGTGQRRLLQDRIIPGESLMTNMWASLDLSRLLAVSWLPGLPSQATQRMTVDPPRPDIDAMV